jgi:hypothetical protein
MPPVHTLAKPVWLSLQGYANVAHSKQLLKNRLIIPQEGEGKAHACVKAWLQQSRPRGRYLARKYRTPSSALLAGQKRLAYLIRSRVFR